MGYFKDQKIKQEYLEHECSVLEMENFILRNELNQIRTYKTTIEVMLAQLEIIQKAMDTRSIAYGMLDKVAQFAQQAQSDIESSQNDQTNGLNKQAS